MNKGSKMKRPNLKGERWQRKAKLFIEIVPEQIDCELVKLEKMNIDLN